METDRQRERGWAEAREGRGGQTGGCISSGGEVYEFLELRAGRSHMVMETVQ